MQYKLIGQLSLCLLHKWGDHNGNQDWDNTKPNKIRMPSGIPPWYGWSSGGLKCLYYWQTFTLNFSYSILHLNKQSLIAHALVVSLQKKKGRRESAKLNESAKSLKSEQSDHQQSRHFQNSICTRQFRDKIGLHNHQNHINAHLTGTLYKD